MPGTPRTDPSEQDYRTGLPTICQPQFVNFLSHLDDRLTTNPACIVARAIPQHGHQDTQQSVANIASSLAMALPLGPQRRIHPAEVRIALHGHARHVIQRMA